MTSSFIHQLEKYIPNTTGVKRLSSVLLPLIKINGTWHLLYEVRALNLSSQPGEICFPGGKIEGKETPKTAAIRETCEELLIDESHVEVIGQLDSVLTSFNMLIHCYVGIIHTPYESIQFSTDEVDHVFTVPLETLKALNPEEHLIDSAFSLPEDFPYDSIPNGKDYNFRNKSYPIIFYRYRDYDIWGLTARMTQNFINILNGTEL